MSRWCRAAARNGLALVFALAAQLRGQSITLGVSGLLADSMPPAPFITASGFPNDPSLAPYTIQLVMSTEPAFAVPFFVGTSDNLAATFTLDSLLAEHETVYLRARLIDVFGRITAEVRQTHAVRGWLRLVDPPAQSLAIVNTRKPRFTWSSPPITLPPGLWNYDLTVINTRSGLPEFFKQGLEDTSYVFTDSLEANTSYSWQVHARGVNNRGSLEVTVRSPGTFVISSSDRPTATIFYQNFPNPFGRGQRSSVTCFWFDLDHPTQVHLDIYDLHLLHVRTIIPGAAGSGTFAAGAYGRQNVSTQSGCDPAYQWDGRDDRGRFVSPGVYVGVFSWDGGRTTHKMIFKGP